MEVYYINEESNGSAYLAVGEKTIMFDPGMVWNGQITIENTKKIIGDRPLDAVFLTHSHYDHVAAVPQIRKAWPDVKVYSAAYCAEIIVKPSARKLIRSLSEAAAAEKKTSIASDYDMNLLYVDEVLECGRQIQIGDMNIEIIESIGHTKCSVSYVINKEWIILSETFGIIDDYGAYSPLFLISHKKAMESMDRISHYKVKNLCVPHMGIKKPDDIEAFWISYREQLIRAKDLMVHVLENIKSEDEQIIELEKAYWRPENRKGAWPRRAFDINAGAMLKTISREYL